MNGAAIRSWSGEKEHLRTYVTGYLSSFLTYAESDGAVIPSLRIRSWSGENTVVVGGKYGRGRGKIRSWSGENTVVVGGKYGRGRGKFSARNAYRSSRQINGFLYLCSK